MFPVVSDDPFGIAKCFNSLCKADFVLIPIDFVFGLVPHELDGFFIGTSVGMKDIDHCGTNSGLPKNRSAFDVHV